MTDHRAKPAPLMTPLASLLASWRAEPDRPIADFGLSIVLLESRPHWSAGDERAPLSTSAPPWPGASATRRRVRLA